MAITMTAAIVSFISSSFTIETSTYATYKVAAIASFAVGYAFANS